MSFSIDADLEWRGPTECFGNNQSLGKPAVQSLVCQLLIKEAEEGNRDDG